MASQAKEAVKDFMSKSGHHDTSVHERVAPAVTHENITRTQHENVTTAVDKEVHQDHYHTSVQPVEDREILPEQHKHNIVGVEQRSYEHGTPKDVEAKLATEKAKFRDERVVGNTEHTHSVAPTVGGEHIHHHVHETIQPVVQKEVVQPSVVHTTVPVHETHHNAAQHHSTSALPAVSLSDFQKQGGTLGGRAERQDAFEGEPRSVGGALSGNEISSGMTGSHGTHSSGMTGSHGTHSSGMTGSHGTHSSGLGSHKQTDQSYAATGEKPTMGEKMNPKYDADGDGKKGMMD